MIEYTKPPDYVVRSGDSVINCFSTAENSNMDKKTVQSFGEEWSKFKNFSTEDLKTIGADYFDILPFEKITDGVALDVGCGTGRWAKYLASKVRFIECIDPSKSVHSAVNFLGNEENTRVTLAGVDNIPFGKNQFDLVYSLGVLHHIPDTYQGILHCIDKLKPGGYFLIYLYYNLDNRGSFYKNIFDISNFFRRIISICPGWIKQVAADLIALTVYLPFVMITKILLKLNLKNLAKKIPLNYYAKTSWNIIRNDSLDRFGTPLEKRFSKEEINEMLLNAGLINIRFSTKPPYWHAIGQKA